MADAEIKNLRDLMRAATPGPLTVMARNHGEQCVAVVNNLELVPPYGVELAHELDDADLLAAAVNALPSLLDEIERLKRACSMMNDEVSQTLGRALRYPRFCDDQKNFPGSTDADGVCVGDHVAESLAAEAAKEIERLRADAARLDHIEKHARYDPKIDGNHAWWPTTFENVLRGPTLRAAIDAAMGGEARE